MSKANFKSGYCCIVGRPNAGKSTLLNRVCGDKLAIVTSKPQTTRDKIIGIKTTDNWQIIFIDTPGLHEPEKSLNIAMMQEAESAIEDADLVLFLCDPSGRYLQDDLKWLLELQKSGKQTILAINKVDMVAKEKLLPLISELSAKGFETIIPISARTGSGIEPLEQEILKYMPDGPQLYPPEMITERNERFLVSETIREKLFLFTHKEIPYSVMVGIEEFIDKGKNLSTVSATIYVERDSQKGIVIGKGGSMIKRIGQAAREEIEERLDRRFFIELRVKVQRDWTEDSRFIRETQE